MAGQSFKDQDCPLNKGDILTLYTDGLTEARQNGRLFGEARLLSLIEKTKKTPPKELPDIIFKNVADFAGGKFVDDVAVISVSPS